MRLARRIFTWLNADGRGGRLEYNLVLWPVLCLVGALILQAYARDYAGFERTLGSVFSFLVMMVSLLAVAMITIGRRLHDIGQSIHWAPLMMLAVQVVHLVFDWLFPEAARSVGVVLSCVLAGGALIYLAIKPGDLEANEYGASRRVMAV